MRQGRLEVICGPMFSGKTEELIRRVKRAKIAKQKVQVFKPAIDTRYDAENVVSHSTLSVESTPVKSAEDLWCKVVPETDVVGIDEVQFFDPLIRQYCEWLVKAGKRVIVAGLDMDFNADPFGEMPVLMSIADSVQKVRAVCVQCGEDANMTYRMSSQVEQVVVGGAESYEPRCRNCFQS